MESVLSVDVDKCLRLHDLRKGIREARYSMEAYASIYRGSAAFEAAKDELVGIQARRPCRRKCGAATKRTLREVLSCCSCYAALRPIRPEVVRPAASLRFQYVLSFLTFPVILPLLPPPLSLPPPSLLLPPLLSHPCRRPSETFATWRCAWSTPCSAAPRRRVVSAAAARCDALLLLLLRAGPHDESQVTSLFLLFLCCAFFSFFSASSSIRMR